MNKSMLLLLASGVALATAWLAHARDDKHLLPIAAVLQGTEAQGKLDGSVKLFFGRETAPQLLETLRSDVVMGKAHTRSGTAENVCNSAFLSAVIQLHKRAKQLGANAVVRIVSYYKNVEMSSPTEFECHQGVRTTGVALKGDFVKIGNQ
jgi:uncharacterized protein YbjQ (UPF0145 family)